MMKLKDLLTPSFGSLLKEIDAHCDHRSWVDIARSDDSDFCRDTVARGILTPGQMQHAAARYRLGKSKSGKCIYWMIDEQGRVRDGHLADSWVSKALKARHPDLLESWDIRHCLFGLHLLKDDRQQPAKPVCLVEKEPSAVILSELFPEQTWLAVATPYFSYDLLKPLRGHRTTVFPHTDSTGSNYVDWLDVARFSQKSLHIDIRVHPLVEDSATAEQKERSIDLLDLYLEDAVKPPE